VSTEVIAEQHHAGETTETITNLYALTPTDVAWALLTSYCIQNQVASTGMWSVSSLASCLHPHDHPSFPSAAD
jgi:hypothetical protein